MNNSALLADIAVVLSILTPLGIFYRSLRSRERKAGAAPFIAGQVAIQEAETALQWKDRRLKELTESEAKLRIDLAAAVATSAAQQEQLTKLQSRLYILESENRDLRERNEEADRRDRQYRDRVGQLEMTVEELQRKLALHNPGY